MTAEVDLASVATDGAKDTVVTYDVKPCPVCAEEARSKPHEEVPADPETELNAVLAALEVIMCQEVCFEVHREARTGLITHESLMLEAKAREAHGALKRKPTSDIYGRTPPKEVQMTCFICGRSMTTNRYANHLDKCALGNGRACARQNDYNGDGTASANGHGGASNGFIFPGTSRTASLAAAKSREREKPPKSEAAVAKKAPKKKPQQPLRIRIALKNGKPVQTYQRVLVPLDPTVLAAMADVQASASPEKEGSVVSVATTAVSSAEAPLPAAGLLLEGGDVNIMDV